MNKKTDWKKYITTSLLTMVVLVFCSFLYLWYDTVIGYDINFKQEAEIPQALVMYKIDELKSDPEHWDNPRLCYEIGSLYESIYLFDIATKYYLRSIEIAPKTYLLPFFKLATLNMERGKMDDAISIMYMIPDINNSIVKKQKGLFWEQMAIKYEHRKNIDAALETIKKAIWYYKSVDDIAYKQAKEEQAFLLMRKSEQLIDKQEINEAVRVLEEAQKINDSAELTYRLAVLNYKNDNEKALKYFEQVQKQTPEIINYDLYYELINLLLDKAKQEQNIKDEILYKHKAEKLRKYVNNNFISQNEFVIENIKITKKSTLWGIKKKVDVNFDIYNNTKKSVRNLYAQANIDVNGIKFSETIKIHPVKNVFLPYTTIKEVNIPFDISKIIGSDNDINGKIYLYKNPNFNKIELGKF